MTPAVDVEYAVRLDCCADENPLDPKHIVLPHQSPLGTFEYPQCQLSGEWPVTFLCLRHGQLFVRSKANLHLEGRTPDLDQPPVWRIECVCAHEDCQKSRTIYVGRMATWENIVSVLRKANPNVSCGAGHCLVFRGRFGALRADCIQLPSALICALEVAAQSQRTKALDWHRELFYLALRRRRRVIPAAAFAIDSQTHSTNSQSFSHTNTSNSRARPRKLSRMYPKTIPMAISRISVNVDSPAFCALAYGRMRATHKQFPWINAR